MKPNEHIGKVKELVNGYKNTYVLITAARIGIFTVLATKDMTVKEVAERLGYEERKIEPVLNALVHFGLIEKKNDIYSLTEYKDVLDPNSPESQLGYINHALNMADKWRKLEDTIKTTAVATDNFNSITGTSYSETKAFLQAMNTNAIPQVRFLISKYNFEGHKFIDIGAGYGTYSIEIVKKYKTAQGVAFDLPVAAQVIEENVIEANVSDKVIVVSGNYKENLPKDIYDDAFLFAVIHQESEGEVEVLLKSVYDRLKKGGKLYLTSFFLDDTRTAPPFSVLFGVEMLVGSVEGHVYSYNEIQELLSKAGFISVECVPEIPGPSTLYIAQK